MIEDVDAGTVNRAPLSHDVDDVETLEGRDAQGNEQEERGRGEQRPCDESKLLPRTGTVQGCRLVVIPADALKAGEEDHHGIADDLPHRDAHQAPKCQAMVAQPVLGGHLEETRQVIDQAVLGIEHPDPEQRHGHPGHDVGREDARLEKAAEGSPSVQKQRQDQCGRHRGEHDPYGVSQRVPNHLAELSRGCEFPVVQGADKLLRHHHIPAEEAEIQGVQHGVDEEGEEDCEGGQDQGVAEDRLPAHDGIVAV